MKVIGAGLCRTGTLSLRQFFEDNSFSPSYHGSQAINSYDQEFWAKCFDESNSDAIVKFMKERGYLSTSDVPACFAVKELADAFPDAKIILGVRDSPKAWLKSFQNTVLQHALEVFFFRLYKRDFYSRVFIQTSTISPQSRLVSSQFLTIENSSQVGFAKELKKEILLQKKMKSLPVKLADFGNGQRLIG